MLTRTATRRSASVLMLALIAMLLVATSGSTRTSQHRVSAGAGHSIAAPHPGRHVHAVVPAPADQGPWHLDFAALPPADAPRLPTVIADSDDTATITYVGADRVAEVGRAPPVLL